MAARHDYFLLVFCSIKIKEGNIWAGEGPEGLRAVCLVSTHSPGYFKELLRFDSYRAESGRILV